MLRPVARLQLKSATTQRAASCPPRLLPDPPEPEEPPAPVEEPPEPAQEPAQEPAPAPAPEPPEPVPPVPDPPAAIAQHRRPRCPYCARPRAFRRLPGPAGLTHGCCTACVWNHARDPAHVPWQHSEVCHRRWMSECYS